MYMHACMLVCMCVCFYVCMLCVFAYICSELMHTYRHMLNTYMFLYIVCMFYKT